MDEGPKPRVRAGGRKLTRPAVRTVRRGELLPRRVFTGRPDSQTAD